MMTTVSVHLTTCWYRNLIVLSLDIYGTANGHTASKRMRTVIHLSLWDSLPVYGPIASMTFSLARNGVGFQLLALFFFFYRIVLFQNLLLRLDLVSESWEASPYSRYLDLTFFFFCYLYSVTFQCLQNTRYIPSVDPTYSGHCPSYNLSRPAGFPAKIQWILSKLRTILPSPSFSHVCSSLSMNVSIFICGFDKCNWSAWIWCDFSVVVLQPILILFFMQMAWNGRSSRTQMSICLYQRSVLAVYLTLCVDHPRRWFHWSVYWQMESGKIRRKDMSLMSDKVRLLVSLLPL